MILSIQLLYILVGLILAITAVMTLADKQHPKRYTSALFWGLYALVFLIGDQLPTTWVGVGAIAMAVIAGLRGVGAGKHPRPHARAIPGQRPALGNKLFMPALAIPLVTVIGTVLMSKVKIGDASCSTPRTPRW